MVEIGETQYRLVPTTFRDYPLLRSYATMILGRLHRVEVRRDPISQHTVQVATPMPDRLMPLKQKETIPA